MYYRILFFFCIIILISCSAREDKTSVVLARVGDEILTTKDLVNISSGAALSKDFISAFIEEWVDNTILYQSAKKRGLLTDEQLKHSRDAYYKKIVVAAYVDTETYTDINITKEDVRAYYTTYRDEFFRGSDEVYAHHFIALNISDARNVRDQLIGTSKNDQPSLGGFFIESVYIKKGRLINKLDGAIFNTREPVVGPIKTSKGYHVFDIVHRYSKGSTVGLDASYDEIYQRLIKQKAAILSLELLDSLKRGYNIFINSNYH